VLADDPAFLLDLDLVPADLSNLEALNEMDQRVNEDTPALSSTRDSTQMDQSSQRSFGGLMIPPSASSMTPAGGGDLFGIGRDSSTYGKAQQPVRLLDDEDLELDLGFDDQIEEHHRSTGHGSGAHARSDRFSVPALNDEDAVPVQDDVSNRDFTSTHIIDSCSRDFSLTQMIASNLRQEILQTEHTNLQTTLKCKTRSQPQPHKAQSVASAVVQSNLFPSMAQPSFVTMN
jgi:hypothetical protein